LRTKKRLCMLVYGWSILYSVEVGGDILHFSTVYKTVSTK